MFHKLHWSLESSTPHYPEGGTGHVKSGEEKREKDSQRKRKRKEIVFTKTFLSCLFFILFFFYLEEIDIKGGKNIYLLSSLTNMDYGVLTK